MGVHWVQWYNTFTNSYMSLAKGKHLNIYCGLSFFVFQLQLYLKYCPWTITEMQKYKENQNITVYILRAFNLSCSSTRQTHPLLSMSAHCPETCSLNKKWGMSLTLPSIVCGNEKMKKYVSFSLFVSIILEQSYPSTHTQTHTPYS